VRKSVLTACAALLLLAGCGGSKTVDPAQGAAELGLNRGPQDYAGPAIDAPQATRRLAALDVRHAGGTWTTVVPGCKRSGPVMSCEVVLTGHLRGGHRDVRCSATFAVRLRAERGTAHRTPYACGPGA
jgi:hypothetical protein